MYQKKVISKNVTEKCIGAFFILAILVLFSNFEAKRAKNDSKNQKTYLVNVS
jgi:hypothetical protein